MKKIKFNKKSAALLLTGYTALMSAPLLATELHYLVSVNDQPRGVLVLDVHNNNQVTVSHRGLSSGDNLPFYAETKSFSLIKDVNNPATNTLSSISVNQNKNTLHYDTNDQLGKDLLKLARVATVDSKNRAFIIDEQNRPIYNFPAMGVLNTEGLLLALSKANHSQGQQLYYFEPSSNRFLRTYLEKGTPETLNASSCKVTSRLLRLDQDGQPNVPMIKLELGTNYALNAAAASGAWSLQLVAAGTPKQYQLPINDQVLALSSSYLKNLLPQATINQSNLRIVRNNYLISQKLSYQVAEEQLEQLALEDLGIADSNIKVKKSTQSYQVELPIKNSCNAIIKDLSKKIEQSITAQAQMSLPDLDKVKVSLTAKDASCSQVEVNVAINAKELFNGTTAGMLVNDSLRGYSKTLRTSGQILAINTSFDDQNLTKKINLQTTGNLDETYLKSTLLANLDLTPQAQNKLSQQLVNQDGSYVASVSKQQTLAKACSNQAIKLSTASQINLESTSAKGNECIYQLTHSLPEATIAQTVVSQFLTDRPHLKLLNNSPKIEGDSLVFNGVYGIAGESDACQ